MVPVCEPAADKTTQNLLEGSAKLLAHARVDEGVDAAVDEAAQVHSQHGEEEVALAQEALAADALDLGDQRRQVERRPRHDEGHGDDDDHSSHLWASRGESERREHFHEVTFDI